MRENQRRNPFNRSLPQSDFLLWQIERYRNNIPLGQFVPGELTDDPPLVEDHDPVAAADELGVVGAIEDDPLARIRQLAQQRIDLLFGADVDAARRVIEQNQTGVGQQPLGDHNFLLVAAGQRTNRNMCTAGADRKRPEGVFDRAHFGPRADEAATGNPIEASERDVVAHGERQDEPIGLAVRGDERHAH